MNCFSIFPISVLGDQEFLFITQNSIKKYDITNNNTTVPINDDDTRLSNLNDVDFDFELQIMFYLVGRKQIYSYNLITKEQKVHAWPNEMISLEPYYAIKSLL